MNHSLESLAEASSPVHAELKNTYGSCGKKKNAGRSSYLECGELSMVVNHRQAIERDEWPERKNACFQSAPLCRSRSQTCAAISDEPCSFLKISAE